MSTVWQVQQAKNHFSEVIDRALTEGPQTVTRHGKPVVQVVAVSAAPQEPQRQRSRGQAFEGDGFFEFLMSAPKIEGGLPEMPRDTSPGRAPLFGEE
ncbi:hypothetical protein MASR1M59_09500 [Melaminivora sp.]